MIAAAHSHEAAPTAFRADAQGFIKGSAHFERTGLLQELVFEVDIGPQARAQGVAHRKRRALYMGTDTLARQLDIGQGHRNQLNISAAVRNVLACASAVS